MHRVARVMAKLVCPLRPAAETRTPNAQRPAMDRLMAASNSPGWPVGVAGKSAEPMAMSVMVAETTTSAEPTG